MRRNLNLSDKPDTTFILCKTPGCHSDYHGIYAITAKKLGLTVLEIKPTASDEDNFNYLAEDHDNALHEGKGDVLVVRFRSEVQNIGIKSDDILSTEKMFTRAKEF